MCCIWEEQTGILRESAGQVIWRVAFRSRAWSPGKLVMSNHVHWEWMVLLTWWTSECEPSVCQHEAAVVVISAMLTLDNVFTSWCSDSRCFNLNLSDFKMLIVCVGALDWAHPLKFRDGWNLHLRMNGIGFLPKLIRALICWPYVKQVHILVDASFLWSSYLHEMSVRMHYWQDFFPLIL